MATNGLQLSETAGDLSDLHVAVLDDCRYARRMLHAILHSLKAGRITVFKSSSEALEGMRALAPDVLISDIHMAEGMDGIELIRKLRAESSEALRRLPVMMLTAHSEMMVFREAMAAGANDFVTKPVSIKQIGTRVRRLCGARS